MILLVGASCVDTLSDVSRAARLMRSGAANSYLVVGDAPPDADVLSITWSTEPAKSADALLLLPSWAVTRSTSFRDVGLTLAEMLSCCCTDPDAVGTIAAEEGEGGGGGRDVFPQRSPVISVGMLGAAMLVPPWRARKNAGDESRMMLSGSVVLMNVPAGT